MEIKNRLFPYPVLCYDNDDYEETEFYVSCNVREDLNDLILDFSFDLKNNEELEWLIREGYAEYVIHIECSYTAFRTAISGSGKTITYRLPKSKINIEVALLGMVVAPKKINSFKCSKLNEDYEDENVSFEKGSILAYYNLPKVYVTKNYEEFASDNAFFTIIRRETADANEQNPVTYDISSPKIKILVDAGVYDNYAKYRVNSDMESLLNTLLIMPSLMFMIETLRTELNQGDLEAYRHLYWYQKINKACKLQGKEFLNDYIDNEISSVYVAQELLKSPINRAFDGLSRVIEE